jgi:hypothetical protein
VNLLAAKAFVVCPNNNRMSDRGHDERTLMSEAEQRDMAEALFDPKQGREEIKDAIKLEEARRAATVKNLYRLRSLRLSRNQTSTPKREG